MKGAQGVKIAAKDLDKAVAGLPLTVAHHKYELEVLKQDAVKQLAATLNAVRTVEEGVVVQVSQELPSALRLSLALSVAA